MTSLRPALLVVLWLVACDDGGKAPVAGPDARTAPVTAAETSFTAPVPASPPDGLAGEYRIAGIDGEALDAPVGIAVSFSQAAIELAPCAGLAWRYIYASGTVETERLPPAPDGLMCRISPEVAAAGAAFDAANRVSRTPANGLEVSGGRHSVLLFSQ